MSPNLLPIAPDVIICIPTIKRDIDSKMLTKTAPMNGDAIIMTDRAIEIAIKEFINSEEFDPLFIEKSYYIGPDTGKKKKGSDNTTNTIPAKAYSLFVRSSE